MKLFKALIIQSCETPTNTINSINFAQAKELSLKLKSSRSSERNPSFKLPTLAWGRLHTRGTSWSCSS